MEDAEELEEEGVGGRKKNYPFPALSSDSMSRCDRRALHKEEGV